MKRNMYQRIFSIVIALALGIGIGAVVFPKDVNVPPINNSSNSSVVNQNINTNQDQDPWWWGIGTFQKSEFRNSACNLKISVPKGWYLQQESYSAGTPGATALSSGQSCYTQLGDDGILWKIGMQSYMAADNSNLQAWINNNLHYDVSFKAKKFGNVNIMYAEKASQSSDDQNQHIVVVSTAGWVHIMTYYDKESVMTRQSSFEQLVASIQPYIGEPNL
jgi:hypothetical protein